MWLDSAYHACSSADVTLDLLLLALLRSAGNGNDGPSKLHDIKS